MSSENEQHLSDIQRLTSLRTKYYPGWHVYPETYPEDVHIYPFYRVIVYSEAEYRLARLVKPSNIRAEIVIKERPTIPELVDI